jgi:hypothetical protein
MFNTISHKGPGQSVPVAPRSLYNEASKFELQSNMHMPSLVIFSHIILMSTTRKHVLPSHHPFYLLPKSLACKFLVMLGSFTTKPSNSLLMHT